MEFIEASIFSKFIYEYLTEEEYVGLQAFLLHFREVENIPAHILRKIAEKIKNG